MNTNKTLCEVNLDKFAKLFTPYSPYDKVIEEKGCDTEFSDRIDINYSSILTKLIQLAGRYCESYASDLFIDWSTIDESLVNGTIESGAHLFGFREMGVDHSTFVFSRACNSPRFFHYEYRAIWRLDIEVSTDDDYWYHKPKKYVKMSLYRVGYPSDWTLDKFFKEIAEE